MADCNSLVRVTCGMINQDHYKDVATYVHFQHQTVFAIAVTQAVTSGWCMEGVGGKEELRCVSITCGEQHVGIIGGKWRPA